MDWSRRTFLKAVALTGVAAATSGKLLPKPTLDFPQESGRPLRQVALIQDLLHSAPFLAGARAAQPHGPASLIAQRCDRGVGFVRVFHTQLHSGQPTRMIGLVDDANAALVLDLVRSAGVPMAWLGQHTVSANGYSRHRILTAGASEGRGLRLGQQLNAWGLSFSLTEQPAAQPGRVSRMASASARPPPGDRWAFLLGATLAELTAHPAAPPPSVPTSTRSVAWAGNFVSFSFQT